MAQTQRSRHCSCSPYQKAHGCFRSPQSSSCRTLLGGEGGQLSLTGANASQLCWIFMQMHPTPLLPPQDTQMYKKNPVLTHAGGCNTQEENTKLENTITAIIPGGEPLLGLGKGSSSRRCSSPEVVQRFCTNAAKQGETSRKSSLGKHTLIFTEPEKQLLPLLRSI